MAAAPKSGTPAPTVLQDDPGRVPARRSHHPSSRVRPGAGHIKVIDRSPVAGPPEERAHREELVERHVAVADVPAGQAVDLLEVERREDLAVENGPAQVRDVRGESVDGQV